MPLTSNREARRALSWAIRLYVLAGGAFAYMLVSFSAPGPSVAGLIAALLIPVFSLPASLYLRAWGRYEPRSP